MNFYVVIVVAIMTITAAFALYEHGRTVEGAVEAANGAKVTAKIVVKKDEIKNRPMSDAATVSRLRGGSF